MSLAGGILQLVEEAAARDGFMQVKRLELQVGKLAGVELSALRFALEVASHGTCLAGAEISIDEPAGQGWCMPCAQNVAVHARGQGCPLCGGSQLLTTGGDQLRVLGLVVPDQP
jgi:hydrogenase nickel incorporation protein HypA/HybF